MSEIVHSRLGVLTYLAPLSPLIEDDVLSELKETVETCISSRETNLILDLAKVSLVNGSALDVMIDIQNRLSRVGGSLKTINANAMIKDIFRICSFHDYVENIDE